jgi:hypothetical protein
VQSSSDLTTEERERASWGSSDAATVSAIKGVVEAICQLRRYGIRMAGRCGLAGRTLCESLGLGLVLSMADETDEGVPGVWGLSGEDAPKSFSAWLLGFWR